MQTNLLPNLLPIPAFRVAGLRIRTNNAHERDPSTGKIGPLWQQFGQSQDVGQALAAGAQVYGVYSGYASDWQGDFDVTAGVRLEAALPPALSEVQVEAADYLVFAGQGTMPQTVIEVWGAVWAYFSQPDCPHQRLYGTDFEAYTGMDRVAVHIGVSQVR